MNKQIRMWVLAVVMLCTMAVPASAFDFKLSNQPPISGFFHGNLSAGSAGIQIGPIVLSFSWGHKGTQTVATQSATGAPEVTITTTTATATATVPPRTDSTDEGKANVITLDAPVDSSSSTSGGPDGSTQTAIVPPPPPPPPPPVTNQTLSPGSYSAVGISGSGTTLNLNAGTYHMQSLSVTNGAQIVFNGPVVLYISGDLIVDAASLQTAGNQPSNLLILGTAGCTKINITGPGTVNAAIYAPAAAVTLNNVTVHGAVVGNTFTSNNSVVNYDVTLRTLTYPGVGQASARSVEEFGDK